MREIRQSGSEGGARFNPLSLPLSAAVPRHAATIRVGHFVFARPGALVQLEGTCFKPKAEYNTALPGCGSATPPLSQSHSFGGAASEAELSGANIFLAIFMPMRIICIRLVRSEERRV